jgi:hypothetical protein
MEFEVLTAVNTKTKQFVPFQKTAVTVTWLLDARGSQSNYTSAGYFAAPWREAVWRR